MHELAPRVASRSPGQTFWPMSVEKRLFSILHRSCEIIATLHRFCEIIATFLVTSEVMDNPVLNHFTSGLRKRLRGTRRYWSATTTRWRTPLPGTRSSTPGGSWTNTRSQKPLGTAEAITRTLPSKSISTYDEHNDILYEALRVCYIFLKRTGIPAQTLFNAKEPIL